jgi:hypothetical protein
MSLTQPFHAKDINDLTSDRGKLKSWRKALWLAAKADRAGSGRSRAAPVFPGMSSPAKIPAIIPREGAANTGHGSRECHERSILRVEFLRFAR